MQSVVTVGLDIAKNVFQAHGVVAEGEVVLPNAGWLIAFAACISHAAPDQS